MSDHPTKRKPEIIPISDLLIVVAIISSLAAFLIPAVDLARTKKGREPISHFLRYVYQQTDLFFIGLAPIAMTGCVAIVVGLLRLFTPQFIRAYFPWKTRNPKPQLMNPEPVDDSRPAIASFILCLLSVIILVFAVSHFRSDRSSGHTIVTIEGPLSGSINFVLFAGYSLAAFSFFLSIHATMNCRGRWNFLAYLVEFATMMIVIFGTIIWAAIYED